MVRAMPFDRDAPSVDGGGDARDAGGLGGRVVRPHEVFVYGTLRPGLSNWHVAERVDAVPVREAWAEGLELFDLDPEGYPAVVPGRRRVRGCILRVRELGPLDDLEDVHAPLPRYERRRWRVDGRDVWIYLYLLHDRLRRIGARRVAGGDWARIAARRRG